MVSVRQWLRSLGLMLAAIAVVLSLKACATAPEATGGGASPSATGAVASQSAQPMQGMADMAKSGTTKININTAILSELDKLEAKLGVPALSHKIQASRPYGSIEDLVSKQVVTQAQFDQVKALLTVEDIVLTGEAKDVDYMTKLGLMKGHMIVAGELLALNQPKQAEPHLGHPVEEIYVDVADQLTERGAKDFKDSLMQVQDLVKSKPTDPQVQVKYDAAMAGIDQAIAVLPATQRQSPKFVLQVINGLLETAVSEYTAAIANGKISAVIEYQDSRGFVLYAQQLYKTVESELSKTDAKSSQQLSATFKQLQTAWPAAIAPAKPVMTVDQVVAAVKQIEQTIKPLVTAAL